MYYDNCYMYKQSKKDKADNHGFSSCDQLLMPLHGGGHTHTYVYTDFPDKINFKKANTYVPVAG